LRIPVFPFLKPKPVEKVDLVPGDLLPIERLYAEYRPVFIPWVMDRFGVSDHYAEEILIETSLVFHNQVDEGRVSSLTTDLRTWFFSLGAAVGSHVTGHYFPSFHLRNEERQALMAKADAQHGVELVDTGWTPPHEPHFNVEMEDLALQAVDKLNPECQRLLKHLARTNLTTEQLAKVLNYSSAVGLKTMYDLCMDRFVQIVTENKGN
jgi:hypothetical protein